MNVGGSFGSNVSLLRPHTQSIILMMNAVSFDGVTIGRGRRFCLMDSTSLEYERRLPTQWEEYNQYGPHVKVYILNSTSWLSRIILIIILAVVLAAVVSSVALSL